MTVVSYGGNDYANQPKAGGYPAPPVPKPPEPDPYLAVIREGPLNVQWPEYAAVGDGLADDTIPVRAALSSGDAFLPPGVYRVTGTVDVPSYRTLSGVNGASILRVDANSNTDGLRGAPGGSHIVIDGITLQGPEDGSLVGANGANTGRGIFLDGCAYSEVRNTRVLRFWLQGIVLNATAQCRVADCAVLQIKAGNGISVDSVAQDTVVTGNVLRDIADCGIGTHNGSLRTIIAGNSIFNTYFGRGVDVYGAPETLISGNTLRDIGGSGAAAHGIWIAQGITGTPHRCVVIGNNLSSIAQDGIQVWGDPTTINDTSIIGNVINSVGLVGIHFGRTSQRSLLASNMVSQAGGHGIHFEEGGGLIPNTAVISANQVRDCQGYGLVATAGVFGLTGAGNAFRNNTAGVISIPAGNGVMYEEAAGYMRLAGGLTVQDMYVNQAYIQATNGTGFLQGVEQVSTPVAPAANSGRLYYEDNGSGKTRLMVRFATGAPQQLSIEP